MALRFERLHKHFVAQVSPIDLRRVHDPETLAEILERLQSLEQRLNGPPGAAVPRVPLAGSGWGAPPGGARSAAPHPLPASAATEGRKRTAGEPGAGGDPAATEGRKRTAGGPGAGGDPTAMLRAGASTLSHSPESSVPAALDATAGPPHAAGEAPARAAREELLWREVVGRVNATKRMLGAFLEESRFVGLSDAGLVLETDDLHATVIDEKENRTIVNDAIRQVFAAHVAFRCVRPSQPLPARARPTTADLQPMIDHAIAFFDGESVDLGARRTEPGPPHRSFRKEKPFG